MRLEYFDDKTTYVHPPRATYMIFDEIEQILLSHLEQKSLKKCKASEIDVLFISFYDNRFRLLLFHIVTFLLENGESEQFLKKIVDDGKIAMMELWYFLALKYWENIVVQPLPTMIQKDQLMAPDEKCFYFFTKKHQDYLVYAELMKIGHHIPMLRLFLKMNWSIFTKKYIILKKFFFILHELHQETGPRVQPCFDFQSE